MTLWQEHRGRPGTAPDSSDQPKSRREARDAERRASETGDLSGVHPSGVYDLNSSGNIWDTLSRRAASQLTEAATEAERRTGRRSDTDHPSEPVTYITQGRPQVPTYEARRPAQPTQQARDAGFQPRNFAPYEDTRTRPTSRIDDLLSQEPVASDPAGQDMSMDHTLTRRELRQRETGSAPRLSQDGASGAWMPTWEPTPQPKAAPAFRAPAAPAFQAPAAPAPASELAGSAFAPYNDVSTVEMAAIDRAALAADAPVKMTPEPQFEEPDVSTVAMDRIAPIIEVPRSAQPVRAEPLPAPAAGTFTTPPAPTAPPLAGLSGFEALIAQASQSVDAPSVPATGPQPQMFRQPEPVRQPEPQPVRQERPFTPPAGHWSVQAAEPDDQLPFPGLTRNVASTSGNTNALIMPNDPQPDLFSAVNSTGEIFITGSLDLPRILSSTGAPSDQYDSSEIDRLFEASQDDHHTADVAPVRAARAVSTHTSTRSVVSPRKRRGGMLPTVLAITAAVMAIGVIGLLFAGYVLRIF
ncbi:hypothetical protein [Naasia aerilata]|uniref:Uncharacterized protein n=1 Tax=Naasia aerilata TaxID=1162966 RepID=A0ABM8GE48_9MICO|nr:hypothetical protein [Naasia aerilata]BDZ46577.1 hypothetical protein GCM10025866_24860 [Naasia aerilata]